MFQEDAILGAAAYTGAVTHTLSVAVIICELTGQLTPLLPVLVSIDFVKFYMVVKRIVRNDILKYYEL